MIVAICPWHEHHGLAANEIDQRYGKNRIVEV